MTRLFAFLVAALLPSATWAAEAGQEFYKFEPTSMLSTLGVIYTLAMVFLFLYVGWLSKRRVATSDDYFAAGRNVGGITNGLAMTSNYMSLATFLGFTALLWKLQFFLVAITLSFLGGFVMISIAIAPWTPRKTLTFGGVTPELASGGLPCRPFGPVFRFLMSVSGVSERVFLYPGALRALSQTRRFIL